MPIVGTIYISLIISIVVFSRFWARRKSLNRLEPPLLHSKIPLIGHVIDMIRYKKDYYGLLRDRCRLPIVTLPLPGSRVYVVFSVPTIQAIQKQSKAFAFQPIQAKFSVKLCGASKQAYQILENDTDQENGEYGNIYTAMHHALSPGDTLCDMNRLMVGRVCQFTNAIIPGKPLKLDAWLRHHVTLATTDAVYGPRNPFRDPKVAEAFWEFERAIPKLIFLPDWLARHGVRNRKIVADAFRNYFLHNHHEHASGLVKDFYSSECSYGFSLSDRSLFEVGHAVATLANTYAAVFWLVFYVFSNPDLLEEIRGEIRTLITTRVEETEDGEGVHHVLDMTKLNSHCPTLISTFRESIRLHSVGISLRQVCKDTLVDGKYSLKKGAVVIMPTIAIHTDPRVWGRDALSFNYRRFLPTKVNNSRKQYSPAAFRSFGGGTTLCPGRHFATTQIMAWASMLIIRFDAEPVSGGGSWVKPTTDKSNVANVITRPDFDLEVNFLAREQYNGGSWNVKVDSNDAIVNVTVEDLD